MDYLIRQHEKYCRDCRRFVPKTCEDCFHIERLLNKVGWTPEEILKHHNDWCYYCKIKKKHYQKLKFDFELQQLTRDYLLMGPSRTNICYYSFFKI